MRSLLCRALGFLPFILIPLLLIPIPALSAQQTESASVPLEVAQVLIQSFGPGEASMPEVHAGTLPEPLRDALSLPAGARIVGTAVFTRSTHSVVALPVPAEASLRQMEEQLLQSGWTRLPQDDERGGFVATAATASFPLCRADGASIVLLAGRSMETEQYVSVHFRGGAEYSGCQRQGVPAGRSRMEVIPRLVPPSGALVQSSGSGSGGDRAEAYAAVQTELDAEAVLRHYGAQLAEYGWHGGTELIGSDLAVQRWEWTDADGALWQGMLAVSTRPEPRRRDVMLRVVQVQPAG
jgi:hypothetical protein